MKEFLKNEKELHKEYMRRRDISFKDFETKLKVKDARTIDIEALSLSLKEFVIAEETQAVKLTTKIV
jgi:hypothetical protein